MGSVSSKLLSDTGLHQSASNWPKFPVMVPDSDSSLYWTVCGVIFFVSSVKLRWMNSRFGQFEFRYSPSPQAAI